MRLTENYDVSTHSRLKAAGPSSTDTATKGKGFNTQPPEGGWEIEAKNAELVRVFQHTAA